MMRDEAFRGCRVYERTLRVALPRERVFAFFCEAKNLERITPPELSFTTLTALPIDLQEGTIIDYRLRLHGVPFGWKTRIDCWEPPFQFVDRQLKGPYRVWHHRHRFEAIEDGAATSMSDEVHYRLPLAPLSNVALPWVRRSVRRIFDFREEAIGQLIADGTL